MIINNISWKKSLHTAPKGVYKRHRPETTLPTLRAPPIGTSHQTQFNWNT